MVIFRVSVRIRVTIRTRTPNTIRDYAYQSTGTNGYG